jgi:hypothetical protein
MTPGGSDPCTSTRYCKQAQAGEKVHSSLTYWESKIKQTRIVLYVICKTYGEKFFKANKGAW